jgi:hypothetical protein
LIRQSCAEFRQAWKLLTGWRAPNQPHNGLAAFGDGDVFACLDHCDKSAQLGFGFCQSECVHDFVITIRMVI